MTRPLLVMGSPPTANGDLHLGHLAGPYLGADIFTRYQRMKGREVFLMTGSDDHQSYVVRKAEALGLSPEETAEMFSSRIHQTLRLAGIEPDVFTPSHSSPIYKSFVVSFFKELWDRDCLVSKQAPALHCPSCGKYLFGADVWGWCANCSERCDGALCESCGHPVVPENLREPECGRCATPAQVRSVQQLVFRLHDLKPQLRSYHMKPRMRPHSYAAVEEMLTGISDEIAVSHPGNWGIPVPVPGFEDQILEVWAEVGPGYLATAQELTASHGDPEGWRRFWCDEDAEIVQFFGFDNTFAHTMLHPALLMAHGGFRLPDHFVINEFYRLDGEKFSSSRSHAVWGADILSAVPSDLVRQHLCSTAPETRQTNFTLKRFRRRVNHNLARIMQGAFDRFYRALVSGRPPDEGSSSNSWTASYWEVFDPLSKVTRAALAMGNALEAETFSLQKALYIWRDMVAHLDAFWRQVEMGQSRLDPHKWNDALRRMGASLTVVTSCAFPLMPNFATRMWKALGIEHDLRTHPWGEPVRLPADRSYKPTGEPWFPEITDAQLAESLPLVAAI